MKTNIVIISVMSILILSCKEDSIVEPQKQNTDNLQSVSLSVGNRYNYFHYNFSNSPSGEQFYQTIIVLRDTTIAGNKYFILSTGEIIRSNSNAVLQWEGASEKITFRFDVKVGDSISYQGNQLKITSITTDSVFIGTQKIIKASNSSSIPDTIFNIEYTNKFGLLYSLKSVWGYTWITSLSGAQIDTTKYGKLF